MRNHYATTFVLALALGLGMASASAATAGVPANSSKSEAATRYAEDKKLCAEESSSAARMQCLRDARSEYDKSLAAAKASSAATPSAASTSACADCGKVIGVRVVEKKGESTPLGMIAGGVAGAVLGHQVGQGRGKDLATIAGAAGGAYAGHKVEQSMRSTKSWVVTVDFDNGTQRDFSFDKDPGYAEGDPVKATPTGLVRR